MTGHLKLYHDYFVVFGRTVSPIHVGFPPTVPRDYCSFIATPWWTVPGPYGPIRPGDPPDGDIDFVMKVDRPNLDAQPRVWVDGPDWFNPPGDITAKLDDPEDDPNDEMHVELLMYGRDADASHCHEGGSVMFPGWAESGGDAILLNGNPVNSLVDWATGNVTVLGQEIPEGTRLRVTGALALDCHGGWSLDPTDWSGDCHDGEADEHNVEIHPTYSVDVLQNFHIERPGATYSGVWASDSVATYYVRQMGDVFWALGMSKDAGATFTSVFKGVIGADGSIECDWATVPFGRTIDSGSLRLERVYEDIDTALTTVTAEGFPGQQWHKLYDTDQLGVPATR